MLLCIAGLFVHVSQGTAPACDTSKPSQDVCSDFCNYKCGFYNTSLGEDGHARNITLYRLTPTNVTGLRNKNTGDAPGDVSYYMSKKNLTQECASHPTSMGCLLDGQNLYGAFVVEVSSQYGPYQECNPAHVGRTPEDPLWKDTRQFVCDMDCFDPTYSGCPENPKYPHKNGTGWGGGYNCWCDGTRRHEKTVGREPMPFAHSYTPGPKWWPAVCSMDYAQLKTSACVAGKVYKQVRGWSFESTAAMACDACSKDVHCTGWATTDNRTAELFLGKLTPSGDACLGGAKYESKYHFGTIGQVGGLWYTTPVAGECAQGKPLGTDGCSWRMVSYQYKNASCVDKLVDGEVEAHGKACFNTCMQPLNRTSNCYLHCYRNTMIGDPSYNISAMKDDQIVKSFERGFADDRLCALVQPAHCSGPQCGPPSLDAGMIVI